MTNLTADAPVTTPRRVEQYLACAGLTALVIAVAVRLDPAIGATTADVIEATTVVLALIAGTTAIVRYAGDGTRGFLILGAGLMIVAVLDAAHFAIGHGAFDQAPGLDQGALGASSWFASRSFLAVFLGWLLWHRNESRAVLWAFGLGLVALVAPMALAALSPTTAGDLPMLWPVAAVVMAGFGHALWTALRVGGWRGDPFDHGLILALVVQPGVDFATGLSVTMDDGLITIALGLKATGYCLVLGGLLASMQHAYRRAQSGRDQAIAAQDGLRAQEEVLRGRLGELEQAQQALEHQGSALAEMAENLTVARGQAEHADRAKTEHLATISHEIRTPLNGVLGMAQLLLDTGLNDLQRRYVDTIISSGRAQLAILNDVLDLSKITADKLDITVEPFDPRVAAESVVELMAGSKEGKAVDLCVRTDPSLPPQIRGDEARFRQILLNLVGNALKFTERGGVTVSLRATAEARNEETIDLVCEIEDTGAGISEGDQQRLFSAFVQADNSAQRLRGTGLGLSICKKLCGLMGGDIGVESTLGEGSCFWFRIQVWTAADGVPTSVAASPGLAGKRALVALDNQTSAATLQYYLERWGAEVSTGSTTAGGGHDMTLVDASGWRQHASSASGALILVAMSLDEVDQGDAARFGAMVRQPVCESTVATALSDLEAAGNGPQPAGPGAAAGDKILVVDDNAVNLELARAVLELAGYEASAARDGVAAVTACAEERFDLILMDLQMPRMDGYEATRAIREADEWGAVVPIIALTAAPKADALAHCQAVGMTDFIAKPFERRALVDLIATAIEANRRPAD